jgi:hypothetical protein
MPWDDPKAASLRGHERMKQIANEMQVEVDRIKRDLIASLARPHLVADQLLAEQIAVATVKARKLRAFGKRDEAERRLLATLLAAWPAPTPGQLQGLTPEQDARCFQRAAPGDEADREVVVVPALPISPT